MKKFWYWTGIILLGTLSGVVFWRRDWPVENLPPQNEAVIIFGDSRYMSDTIHPNDAGDELIAKRLHPVIEKAFLSK